MSTDDDTYWDLAGTVLDRLRDQGPPEGCPHARSAAVLHACAAHPRAGLACAACAADHLQRHGTDHDCVVCGAAGATSAWRRAWPVLRLVVGQPDGARLSWTGGVDALLGYRCGPAPRTGASGRAAVTGTAAPPTCRSAAPGRPLPGR